MIQRASKFTPSTLQVIFGDDCTGSPVQSRAGLASDMRQYATDTETARY